jgi:hypothetical protein
MKALEPKLAAPGQHYGVENDFPQEGSSTEEEESWVVSVTTDEDEDDDSEDDSEDDSDVDSSSEDERLPALRRVRVRMPFSAPRSFVRRITPKEAAIATAYANELPSLSSDLAFASLFRIMQMITNG